jgi:hypothetical protein
MADESHSAVKLKPSTFHRLQDFAASVGRPAAELAEEAIDRWGLVDAALLLLQDCTHKVTSSEGPASAFKPR